MYIFDTGTARFPSRPLQTLH